MSLESSFYVICYTRVKSAVKAFDNIDKPHNFNVLRLGFDSLAYSRSLSLAQDGSTSFI